MEGVANDLRESAIPRSMDISNPRDDLHWHMHYWARLLRQPVDQVSVGCHQGDIENKEPVKHGNEQAVTFGVQEKRRRQVIPAGATKRRFHRRGPWKPPQTGSLFSAGRRPVRGRFVPPMARDNRCIHNRRKRIPDSERKICERRDWILCRSICSARFDRGNRNQNRWIHS